MCINAVSDMTTSRWVKSNSRLRTARHVASHVLQVGVVKSLRQPSAQVAPPLAILREERPAHDRREQLEVVVGEHLARSPPRARGEL